MKKYLWLFLIIMIIAVAYYLKPDGSAPQSEAAINSVSAEEKAKISRFWQYYRSGTQHRIAGRWQQAAEDYRLAIEINPDHEDVLYYLGNMYLETQKYDSSEIMWQRLAAVNPHSSRAHFQLGNLYLNYDVPGIFDPDKAQYEFEQARNINQEESGPVIALGQVALMKGDLAAAENYFEIVIKTNFRSVAAHFLMGYILFEKNQRQESLKSLLMAREYLNAPNPVKGVLGEGDTKGGKSYVRVMEHAFFGNLIKEIKDHDPSWLEMNQNRIYTNLRNILKEKRKMIKAY